MKHICLAFALLCATFGARAGGIHYYHDMNTREISALDAARTVVLIPGGILEQHGPYLPSGTDTFMSEHLSRKLADALVRETDRDVLVLPLIYLGADGANIIGSRQVFPGTLTVRPETLRQVYMDIGDALGEAGFRNVFLVHIHGAPRHNLMLDMAADYFNDTWDGSMVHLYGLMSIQSQWSAARNVMSEEAIEAQGFSVHSSAVEHSTVMHLKPALVAKDVVRAPDWRAETHPEMVALARKPDWPGYFGAPRFASREAGKVAMDAVTDKAVQVALEILGGAKMKGYPRFSDSPQARNAPGIDNEPQRVRQAAWLDAATSRMEER